MRGEYTRNYVGENFPRKPFKKGIVIRKRRPFELFLPEILFALFIIFLLIMLAVNYTSNLNYVRQNKTIEPEKEIDIGVNIREESNLYSINNPHESYFIAESISI